MYRRVTCVGERYMQDTAIWRRRGICVGGICCLFDAIARIFQLSHGGDMMYEMRRKPKPTLLLTQGIYNLAHHINMVKL